MDRKARLEDTRSFEIRDAQIRKQLKMGFVDALHVDPADIPEGMEYQWIRDSLMGEPDVGRRVEMERRGWSPVPADRHPEMMPSMSTRTSSHLNGFIWHKGLILCERPKEYGDIERKMRDDYQMEIMKSLPGQEHFLNDPTMPIKSFVNQTSIEQVKSFKRD